jgi:hypothetical protein
LEGCIKKIINMLGTSLPFIFLALLNGDLMYMAIVFGNQITLKNNKHLKEEIKNHNHNRGQKFKILDDNDTCWKVDASYNYDDEPPYIGNILKNNDLIVKNNCSDTITIYREKSEYYFLIGDALLNSKKNTKDWTEKWRKQRRMIRQKLN